MFFLMLLVLVPLAFIVSLFGLLFSTDAERRKVFKTILLVTLGLLVLGGGLCALLIASLKPNNLR